MSNLLSRALELASARYRMEEVTIALAERRSVALMLPATMPSEPIVAVLHHDLLRKDYMVQIIDATQFSGLDAATAFAQAVGAHRQASVATTVQLIRTLGGTLSDVLLLVGIEQISADAREGWLAILALWAAAPEEPLAPALGLVVSPDTAVIERLVEMPGLNVYWWWQTFSELDAQQLCRIGEQGQLRNGASFWREATLPAIAAGDIPLFIDLWPDGTDDPSTLCDRLRALAGTRGWTLERLRSWGALSVLTAMRARAGSSAASDRGHTRPPQTLRSLWAAGALQGTIESGMQLHAAALAVLQQDTAIAQRLWRGQARVLQPLIDDLRFTVCADLTDCYGQGWQLFPNLRLSVDEANALKEDVFAAQLGHIEHVLLNDTRMRDRQIQWLGLVRKARLERNKLAHYQALSQPAFQALLSALGAI